MNKKLDWAHQRDSYLLRTHFTPRECQNIQVVNSLSKYICHKRSDPLKEGEDSETRSKEVGWLLNLGQKLITRQTKLSSARDIQTYNSINRPRDFELEEMLLHGGLEETVEKLERSPEHISKQALLMVPGIGPDEVAELSEIGICSVDELKNDLSLSNVQARRWRPRDRNQELAQGRYFEQEEKPETTIDFETAARMNEILKYYLEVKPPQVDGVVSVELTGTLGMGRDEDRQIETIIYKPEWKEGEEKEMLRWLQDDRSDSTEEEKKIKGYQRKPLISTVLDWKFAQESTRSNIPESFSLLDGSYARVVRNFGSNRYLSTIWFANESNVGVVRAMTHSSTQGMKALFDFAIVKGYVIHVDGLFTENGFGQGGVPLAVESEEALYRKLGLTFIPSSSRRLNLGEDFLDWSTEGEKATTEKGKGKGKGKERGEGEGVVQNQGLATGKGMGKGKGKKKQLSDVEDEDEEPKKKKGRAKKDSGSGSGVKKRSVEEEEVVSVALTTKRQKTNAAKKGEK